MENGGLARTVRAEERGDPVAGAFNDNLCFPYRRLGLVPSRSAHPGTQRGDSASATNCRLGGLEPRFGVEATSGN